ncbi:dolichol kinase [Drosophila sulfurigaster albostrigata]|uniref:dolichol kinase n=1 Tax=Drosophila sulfurigaster albostrigata TaxID=89887 RepID=UPI002D21CCD3|nr:dolichol kinase [Drosophila sulfurigaster albostrigata]
MERLLPRPFASNGGWLSLLLPLALAVSYLHSHTTTPACSSSDAVHRYLIVIALGTCLRTLCFLLSSGWALNWLFNLLPAFVTSACLALQPETTWITSLIGGFLITTLYQHVYISVMRALPKTFSFGEAAILVQGLVLFLLNATSRIYALFALQAKPITDFGQLNAIMQSALICLLTVCVLLALLPVLRQPLPFYFLIGLLLVAVTCAPVTQPLPLIALLNFILRDQKRLIVIVFYIILVALTGATVSWQLGNSTQANTRVRKIFHLLIVLVFVPGLVYQCALLYIATGVAFAVFVVLELLRLLQMPPFGNTLVAAFESFKDVKDSGQLALTPFCLLIGCSLPIWLTCCPCGQSDNPSLLMLLSGVLAVGVGDTAASVVGSKYGRNKWSNSTRSVEGTIAFVVSILLSVWFLELGGILDLTQGQWFATVFAALNAALVEAFTDQVDNLVLPLVFYILVGLA